MQLAMEARSEKHDWALRFRVSNGVVPEMGTSVRRVPDAVAVSTGLKLHRITGENFTLGVPTCRRIC
jgi:hypothetical protein